jgi:cytochrome c biogenesis protein CcmG, thiol:disulfide interchange protein DsbE
MHRGKLIIGAALVLAVVVALVVVAWDSPQSSQAADVTFIPADEFAVADYAGKPLVVNFFGSWCGPCNLEAPELSAFAADNPDVQFVGIAVDDSEGDVADFMGRYQLDYPVVMAGWDLAGEYDVTGVPETLFYDAAGQEQDRIVGAASRAQFDQSLATIQ